MIRNAWIGTLCLASLCAATCLIGCSEDDTQPFDGGPEPLAWGPSFVGVANDVNDDGDADVALAVFWDLDVSEAQYLDDHCFGIATPVDAPLVGRDIGTLTINGGTTVASQDLTRNDKGYYYLDGVADAWHVGDQVNVVNAEYNAGPATIPTALTQHNLATLTQVRRSEDLVIEASGSDGPRIIASIQGQNATHSYLFGCNALATDGQLVVAKEALAMFPSDVDTIHIKLQGGDIVMGNEFSLVVSGESASVDLPIND